MAGKVYEIHTYNGEHMFVDVDEINFLKVYEPHFDCGTIEINMKDGTQHVINGRYQHTLQKDVKKIYQEILDLRNSKSNNNNE